MTDSNSLPFNVVADLKDGFSRASNIGFLKRVRLDAVYRKRDGTFFDVSMWPSARCGCVSVLVEYKRPGSRKTLADMGEVRGVDDFLKYIDRSFSSFRPV